MRWKEFDEEFSKYPLSHLSTWYTKKVVAKFAKFITFIAYNLEVTPNFLTTLSFFTILLSMMVLIWTDTLIIKLISLMFLQLGYFIDYADGQLARMQGKTTLFGAFFDLFVDRCGNFIVLIVFGVLWAKEHPINLNLGSVLVYVICASLYIIYIIAMSISENVFTNYRGKMQNYGKNLREKIMKVPYHFMCLGIHFLLLSLGHIFGFVYYVVVFYGMLSLSLTVALIFYLYYKDRASNDRLLKQ